jgi:hypothetical protein
MLIWAGPFKRETGRDLCLVRQRKGDCFGRLGNRRHGEIRCYGSERRKGSCCLVVEAKRFLLLEQCFLSIMKDTRDNNGGGTVYGFTTRGICLS